MIVDIESEIVKAEQNSKKVITCTANDLVLRHSPVTILFFYNNTVDYADLRTGLKEALNLYPLFSGRLIENESGIQIDCCNDGVSISKAKHDKPVDHLLKDLFDSPDAADLYEAINPETMIQNREPVLTARVNYFSDNSMCLGVVWNHVIGDMATIMMCISAWSDFVAKRQPEKPQIVENRVEFLKKEMKDNGNTIPILRYLKGFDKLKWDLFMRFLNKHQRRVQFYFTESELTEIQKDLNGKLEGSISINDALCAHIFSIFAKLDPRRKGRKLALAINYRSRAGLDPMVLGNMVSAVILHCDYKQKPEMIGQNLRQMINDYSKKHLDHFPTERFFEAEGGYSNIGRFVPKGLDPVNGTVLLTSWANFGVYDVDFGQEKPIYFTQHGPLLFPWLCSISEGFNNEGLLVSASLPLKVAKEVTEGKAKNDVHIHRKDNDILPDRVKTLTWVH